MLEMRHFNGINYGVVLVVHGMAAGVLGSFISARAASLDADAGRGRIEMTRFLRLAFVAAPLLLALCPSAGRAEDLFAEDRLRRVLAPSMQSPNIVGSHGPVSPSLTIRSELDAPPGEGDAIFYTRSIGARFVAMGLITGNAQVRARGWQELRRGFAHQQPDGSFESQRGAVLGTAFLVSAAGYAVLLERRAGHRDGEELAEPVARAGRWLASLDPQQDRAIRVFARYVHRYWIMASALCSAGLVSRDPALLARADDYARMGLRAQRPDGVNPEGGGFDVGYQATGLSAAARYAHVCATGEVQTATLRMVDRGLTWLEQRIDAEGAVDPTGSTRLLREIGRNGQPKRVSLRGMVAAFAWGAAATGEPRFDEVAARIIASSAFAAQVAPSRN